MNTTKQLKKSHCSKCGEVDPKVFTSTGLTLCCNADVCYGIITSGSSRACCEGVANKCRLAAKQVTRKPGRWGLLRDEAIFYFAVEQR